MQQINIKAEVLKGKLEKGEVKFTYTKVDGTERFARGTTKLEMIPSEVHPKNPGSAHVAYFDLDKNEWRSIAEGKSVTMTVEDLMDPYDMPNLNEDEINLMMFVYGQLNDKWLSNFIQLIMTASPERAVDLSNGFKNLVRVCRNYHYDMEYAEVLREKWNKLTN